MEQYGITHTGMVRENNEDRFFMDKEKHIYMVADGMGGHNAGEVASQMAVDIAGQYINDSMTPDADLTQVICDAITAANRDIYQKSIHSKKLSGMGTTLDVCAFYEDKIITFHVGDSRIYRLRGDELSLMTTDHSFVEMLVQKGELTREEAENHPNRNMITRAVGTESTVLIDVSEQDAKPGDLYLMCSDGLTNMLNQSELEQILKLDVSLEDRANRLVELANEKGGTDNITVLMIEV